MSGAPKPDEHITDASIDAFLNGETRAKKLYSDVVVAGAGTGKTHALVHAYLFALLGLDGSGILRSPSRVLAITFTDKAAAEMRTRVAVQIGALSRGEVSETFQQRLSEMDMALPKSRELDNISRQLPGAPISTFHAFCHSTLHDFAIPLELDPAFTLLGARDESELLAEIGEQCVLDRLAAGDVFVAELTARFGLKRMGYARGLVDEIVGISMQLQERGIDPALLPLATLPERAQARVLELRERLDASMKMLHQLQRDQNDMIRARAGQVLHAYVAFRQSLESQDDAKKNMPSTEAEIEIAQTFGAFRNAVSDAFGQGEVFRIRKSAADRCAEMGAALCDRAAAPHAKAVRTLLVDLAERATREKRARGVLGFGDLLAETRALLVKPELRARVNARFDRILVDEYQDTSPIQEDLIALLGERANTQATTSGQGRLVHEVDLDPGRLFLVGDPKQSIYGFRGADVAVFKRTSNAICAPAQGEASGKRRTLNVSYRSRKNVIEVVNHVARSTLAGGPQGEGSERALSPNDIVDLVAHRRTTSGESAGAFWVPERKVRDVPSDVVFGRVVANGIAELLKEGRPVGDDNHPVRPKDIAVLVRRIKAAEPIAKSLTDLGIAAHIAYGVGFFGRSEVTDTVSALRLLTEPQDELATLTILRSPFVALSDSEIFDVFSRPLPAGESRLECAQHIRGALSESAQLRLASFAEKMRKWRSQLGTKSVAQIVDRLLDDTHYIESLAAHDDPEAARANLEKLRGMAEGPPGRATSTIARLWRYLDDPPKEPLADVAPHGSDAVRILTMHRSKGLEFPVVVLSDLSARAPPDDRPVAFDDGGLAVTHRGRPIETCAPHFLSGHHISAIDRIRKQKREKEQAELARLLYVAMTRARDALFIAGDAQANMPQQGDRDPATLRQLLEQARKADRFLFDRLLPRQKQAVTLEVKEQAEAPEVALVVEEHTTPVEPLLLAPSSFYGLEESAFVIPGAQDDEGESHRGLARSRALRRGRLAHKLIQLVGETHALEWIRDDTRRSKMLDAALALEHERDSPEFQREKAKVEATLCGPIAHLLEEGFTFSFEEPCVYEHGPVTLSGVIDLVARHQSMTLVIDFKSSKNACLHPSSRAQIVAYATALEHRGEPETRFALWEIGDPRPESPRSLTAVDREYLNDAIENAEAL